MSYSTKNNTCESNPAASTQQSYERLQLENEELKRTINWLREQLELNNRTRFGKKSDFVHPDFFPELLDFSLNPDSDVSEDAEEETITYTRKKKKTKGRNIDTSQLPREQVIHDLEDKTCQGCSGKLTQMGQDVSEQLEYIPAQVKVIEHVTLKYTCDDCETIKSATKPQGAIPKCMAGSSLLAEVIISKYENHLPLYRRSKMFEREGIMIPDNTLGNWMAGSAQALKPLLDALMVQRSTVNYLQVDETPVKVLDEDRKGYMWCYLSPDTKNRFVIYDYHLSRSGEVVNTELDGFDGILQTDGYSGYNKFRKPESGVTCLGCFAHARRKFTDALKVAGKTSGGLAKKAINIIGKLYGIESQAKLLSADERLALRQEKSIPLFNAFNQFILEHRQKIPDKSTLGKAFTYAYNQMPYLENTLKFGHTFIDNNLVENIIRPFALGRRNWLFVGNENGGKTAALLYTLIQTCRLNDINARVYLVYVLNQAAAMRRQEVDPTVLLPQFIDTSLLGR